MSKFHSSFIAGLLGWRYRTIQMLGLFSISFFLMGATWFFGTTDAIDDYWQDEATWAMSTELSFWKQIFLPDNGYPVVGSRLILWVAKEIGLLNPLMIHTFVIVLSALSVSIMALMLFRNFSSRLVLVVYLSSFPSFDLRLYFNLGYYIFLTIATVIIVHIKNKEEFGPVEWGIIFALPLFVSKPQLLITLICLLILYGYVNKSGKKLVEIFAVAEILLLVVIGRFQNSALSLEFPANPINFLEILFLEIPAYMFFPIFIVGSIAVYKILDFSGFTFLPSALGVIPIMFYIYAKKSKHRTKLFKNNTLMSWMLLAIYFVSALSLIVFPNTSWGRLTSFNESCITCMSARHWFGHMSISLLILACILKERWLRYLMMGLTTQTLIVWLVFGTYYFRVE